MLRLIAALASAVTVGLAVGALTGSLPKGRARRIERPEVSDRQQWLVQSGVDLTPRQFFLASGLLGLFTFMVVMTLTATPIVALVPSISVVDKCHRQKPMG